MTPGETDHPAELPASAGPTVETLPPVRWTQELSEAAGSVVGHAIGLLTLWSIVAVDAVFMAGVVAVNYALSTWALSGLKLDGIAGIAVVLVEICLWASTLSVVVARLARDVRRSIDQIFGRPVAR